MLKVSLPVILMSLCGCVTAEQQAAYAANDDAYCRSLSAIPGTDGYVQCRFILDQRRRAQQNAEAGALGQALGLAIGAAVLN